MPSEKLPPGPVSRWWSGFFRQYSRDPLGYLTFLFRTYGDVVGLRYFRYRVTFISHPKDIEEVLVNQAKKFAKGRILRANKRLFGNGLLTSEGEFWLRQRRLAQPAFHRARVASYAETMVRYAERMLEAWRDGEERDIHQEMMRLTLQIVAKTLFDADVENDAREVGRALQVVMDLNSNFRRLVMTPPWLPTRHNVRAFFAVRRLDRKSTRLNSSHVRISYAVFCLKKKKTTNATRDAAARRSAEPAIHGSRRLLTTNVSNVPARPSSVTTPLGTPSDGRLNGGSCII